MRSIAVAASAAAAAAACSRPTSLSGTSLCVVNRHSAFQTVSPCRIRSSVRGAVTRAPYQSDLWGVTPTSDIGFTMPSHVRAFCVAFRLRRDAGRLRGADPGLLPVRRAARAGRGAGRRRAAGRDRPDARAAGAEPGRRARGRAVRGVRRAQPGRPRRAAGAGSTASPRCCGACTRAGRGWASSRPRSARRSSSGSTAWGWSGRCSR